MSKVRKQVCDALGILEDAHGVLDETEVIDGELIEAESPNRDVVIREPMFEDDLLNDYRETRETLKSLISKAEIALDGILHLAKESEQARVYEVAGSLVKTISDVSKELVSLHKTMKEIKKEQEKKEDSTKAGDTHQHLHITMADFQKMIEDRNKGDS